MYNRTGTFAPIENELTNSLNYDNIIDNIEC